jgi:hypothetical protein
LYVLVSATQSALAPASQCQENKTSPIQSVNNSLNKKNNWPQPVNARN